VPLLPVGRFETATEARLACGMLRAHGIPAEVADEHSGVLPTRLGQRLGGTSVHVPDADADDARALLREVRLRDEVGGGVDPDWVPPPGAGARAVATGGVGAPERRAGGWRWPVAVLVMVPLIWALLQRTGLL
jgi:hypothetical protein